MNVARGKRKRKEAVPFRLCSHFEDSSCPDTKIAPKMASVHTRTVISARFL